MSCLETADCVFVNPVVLVSFILSEACLLVLLDLYNNMHGKLSSLQGTFRIDEATNRTYCVYSSDVATGYGVGAFLFLLSSESLLMGVTKFMCFGRPLAPGGNRAWTIIYFVFSW